jgi:hypothetical protein
MSTRSKTLGLHEWSKQDTILSLYVTKFGCKGLHLKTESDVAKFIGTSVGSLKMQCANIKSLMGLNDGALSDYSSLQEEVYNQYGKVSQYELMKEVKKITGQDEVERNELLKKLGKDPSKFKKVN